MKEYCRVQGLGTSWFWGFRVSRDPLGLNCIVVDSFRRSQVGAKARKQVQELQDTEEIP